jgi:hypothetical protein
MVFFIWGIADEKAGEHWTPRDAALDMVLEMTKYGTGPAA